MSELKELLEVIREEQRQGREEQRRAREEGREEQRRARAEELRNQARFENTRAMMREMVLELREGREMLTDMRHGIQANTEGLLRVLDEFRREDGPSGASA